MSIWNGAAIEGEGTRGPALFLRLEALLVGALSLTLFRALGGEWATHFLWFLVPDLAIVGYVFGPRVGAWAYNVSHTYGLPAAIALWSVVAGATGWGLVALLWFSHIAFDRLLGFGLKYPTRFTDTHLGRI